MTQAEATFIAQTLKNAFEDSNPRVTPNGNVEYTVTPKGSAFTKTQYVNCVEDFGFQFKELCTKRMAYSLTGKRVG